MTISRPRVLVGVVLASLLGAVIFGYLLGRDHAQEADWHTVTIDRADVVSDEGC